MADPTLIADLVRAGLDPELLQRVALELGRATAEREAIEKRRQSDRERQARRRGHVMSRDVTLQHVTTRDVTAEPKGPAPLPPHTPPITPTPNTIPPVSPDGLPAPEGAGDVAAEAVEGPEVEAGDWEADEGGSKGSKAARARRIPANFAQSPEALAVCAEMGLTGAEASEALAEFCDFWMAEGGQRARKLDWPRTLRNRLREIGRRRPAARTGPHRPRSSNGYFDLLRDELAGSDDQRSDPQRQHL
ncbi:hypothetical protein FHU13_005695, partial [Methylobacterium sp. R2-1]|nr:hypothetical protein [Methylobacterium sp. R2-1]